jgi:hypothetical protein
MLRAVPLARLGHQVLYVTALALVGFAILRWGAEKFNIPALRAILGYGGVAQ